jgi:phosphoribosyl 1,2-cyclic phosphodiesterase
VKVCLLASGSKGNAIYLASRDSRVLIDAGLSAREIDHRLARIDAGGAELDGILLTHEHTDHCRGLGPVSRRHRLPVLLHHRACRELPASARPADPREFDGEPFCWRDLRIEPFALTHDAVAPVGFAIETADGKIGIATDLGIATRLVAERLKGCRVLILESNHDEVMLRDGPYPWHLKQRVRGNHGHLSNADSARLLEELLWPGLEAVFLAHLSETNNTPSLAAAGAREVLERQNLCRPRLIVARQDLPTPCFVTGQRHPEGMSLLLSSQERTES